MSIPTPGLKIPPFSVDTTAGPFRSEANRGRALVLYFYPRDNTAGCAREAADFRDLHAEFRGAGVTILGVSPDSMASHQGFKAKLDLPFELGVDSDHSLAHIFGVWKEKNMYGRKVMGIERSTFLIDGDAVLRREWRKVKVEGHVAAVLAAARSL